MAKRPGKGGRGARALHERVRTARGRSVSSQRWLERQLNDPYVQEAQRLGYRSRAAFKLLQIDEKFALLSPGKRVVDLGAAPGGWTQVAVAKVRPQAGEGMVVAFDQNEMEPVAGAEMLVGDIETDAGVAALRALLGGPADVVLSDMAAAATGHASTDHLRTIALAEAALYFAREVLAPGGAFVTKVLQGAEEPALFRALQREFTTVRRFKPKASRADSTEIYLVAAGFRGTAREQG